MRLDVIETRHLINLYNRQHVNRDRLPYTDALEEMHMQFCIQTERGCSLRQFWHTLSNLGKAGRLARKT